MRKTGLKHQKWERIQRKMVERTFDEKEKRLLNWKWRREKKGESNKRKGGKERGKEKVEEKVKIILPIIHVISKKCGKTKRELNGARRNNIEERSKTNNGGNMQGVKKPEIKA